MSVFLCEINLTDTSEFEFYPIDQYRRSYDHSLFYGHLKKGRNTIPRFVILKVQR